MELIWFAQMLWVIIVLAVAYKIATNIFDLIEQNKKNAAAAWVVFIILIVLSGCFFHDDDVMDDIKDDMNHQYFFQSNNNMSSTEKYDLALSICESVYSDRESELWFPLQPERNFSKYAFELVR